MLLEMKLENPSKKELLKKIVKNLLFKEEYEDDYGYCYQCNCFHYLGCHRRVE